MSVESVDDASATVSFGLKEPSYLAGARWGVSMDQQVCWRACCFG